MRREDEELVALIEPKTTIEDSPFITEFNFPLYIILPEQRLLLLFLLVIIRRVFASLLVFYWVATVSPHFLP